MDKVDFEQLFDEEIAAPLAAVGFQARGRSLHGIVGDAEVALIRLGGRMASPGAASHLLCARKVWMRTREERVPDGLVREPFNYPFKLRPSLLCSGETIQYTPQNLNYTYDTLPFAGASQTSAIVRANLERIRSVVAERVVPWASTLPADAVLAQLEEHGEGAWIERVWIEDCLQRLQQQRTR